MFTSSISNIGGNPVTRAAPSSATPVASPAQGYCHYSEAPQDSAATFTAGQDHPVEFWPTTLIRSALSTDDISVWQRIVVAIKRDPYGRTARQVEEIIGDAHFYGVSTAMAEVLTRARKHLEHNERAEAARHVQILVDRCGLDVAEFASRIGVSTSELITYLEGSVSPSSSLVIRMRRLSDRFARIRAQQSVRKN